MINVIELYNHTLDTINKSQNGTMTIPQFNRFLKRASLGLLRWLTGGVAPNPNLPALNINQKDIDYLKQFVVEKEYSGEFQVPEDYFGFVSLTTIGKFDADAPCDEENIVEEQCDTTITVLDKPKFQGRCGSFIDGLSPTQGSPIAYQVNNGFKFSPKDIGNVRLTYIKYFQYGELKTKIDPVYYNQVPDTVTSVDSELGEWAIDYLVTSISGYFSDYTREQSLKQLTLANEQKLTT